MEVNLIVMQVTCEDVLYTGVSLLVSSRLLHTSEVHVSDAAELREARSSSLPEQFGASSPGRCAVLAASTDRCS